MIMMEDNNSNVNQMEENETQSPQTTQETRQTESRNSLSRQSQNDLNNLNPNFVRIVSPLVSLNVSQATSSVESVISEYREGRQSAALWTEVSDARWFNRRRPCAYCNDGGHHAGRSCAKLATNVALKLSFIQRREQGVFPNRDESIPLDLTPSDFPGNIPPNRSFGTPSPTFRVQIAQEGLQPDGTYAYNMEETSLDANLITPESEREEKRKSRLKELTSDRSRTRSRISGQSEEDSDSSPEAGGSSAPAREKTAKRSFEDHLDTDVFEKAMSKLLGGDMERLQLNQEATSSTPIHVESTWLGITGKSKSKRRSQESLSSLQGQGSDRHLPTFKQMREERNRGTKNVPLGEPCADNSSPATNMTSLGKIIGGGNKAKKPPPMKQSSSGTSSTDEAVDNEQGAFGKPRPDTPRASPSRSTHSSTQGTVRRTPPTLAVSPILQQTRIWKPNTIRLPQFSSQSSEDEDDYFNYESQMVKSFADEHGLSNPEAIAILTEEAGGNWEDVRLRFRSTFPSREERHPSSITNESSDSSEDATPRDLAIEQSLTYLQAMKLKNDMNDRIEYLKDLAKHPGKTIEETSEILRKLKKGRKVRERLERRIMSLDPANQRSTEPNPLNVTSNLLAAANTELEMDRGCLNAAREMRERTEQIISNANKNQGRASNTDELANAEAEMLAGLAKDTGMSIQKATKIVAELRKSKKIREKLERRRDRLESTVRELKAEVTKDMTRDILTTASEGTPVERDSRLQLQGMFQEALHSQVESTLIDSFQPEKGVRIRTNPWAGQSVRPKEYRDRKETLSCTNPFASPLTSPRSPICASTLLLKPQVNPFLEPHKKSGEQTIEDIYRGWNPPIPASGTKSNPHNVSSGNSATPGEATSKRRSDIVSPKVLSKIGERMANSSSSEDHQGAQGDNRKLVDKEVQIIHSPKAMEEHRLKEKAARRRVEKKHKDSRNVETGSTGRKEGVNLSPRSAAQATTLTQMSDEDEFMYPEATAEEIVRAPAAREIGRLQILMQQMAHQKCFDSMDEEMRTRYRNERQGMSSSVTTKGQQTEVDTGSESDVSEASWSAQVFDSRAPKPKEKRRAGELKSSMKKHKGSMNIEKGTTGKKEQVSLSPRSAILAAKELHLATIVAPPYVTRSVTARRKDSSGEGSANSSTTTDSNKENKQNAPTVPRPRPTYLPIGQYRPLSPIQLPRGTNTCEYRLGSSCQPPIAAVRRTYNVEIHSPNTTKETEKELRPENINPTAKMGPGPSAEASSSSNPPSKPDRTKIPPGNEGYLKMSDLGIMMADIQFLKGEIFVLRREIRGSETRRYEGEQRSEQREEVLQRSRNLLRKEIDTMRAKLQEVTVRNDGNFTELGEVQKCLAEAKELAHSTTNLVEGNISELGKQGKRCKELEMDMEATRHRCITEIEDMKLKRDQSIIERRNSEQQFKESLRLLRKTQMDEMQQAQGQIERCKERDQMSSIRYEELKNIAEEDRNNCRNTHNELSMLMNTILGQVTKEREAAAETLAQEGSRRRSSSSDLEDSGSRRRNISPETRESRERRSRQETTQQGKDTQKGETPGRGRSKQTQQGCRPEERRQRRRSRSRSDSDREKDRFSKGRTKEGSQSSQVPEKRKQQGTSVERDKRGSQDRGESRVSNTTEHYNQSSRFRSVLNPQDTSIIDSLKDQGDALRELTRSMTRSGADKALGLPSKFEGTFGGEDGNAEGEEINEWAETVRRSFEAKGCDGRTGRLLIEKILGKEPLLHIRALDPDRLLDAEQVLELLIDRYSSPQSKDRCRTEFRRAHQKRNESLGHFMDTLRRLRTFGYPNEDPAIREEEIMKQFLEGLDDVTLRLEMEKHYAKAGYKGVTTRQLLRETEDTFKVFDREVKRGNREDSRKNGNQANRRTTEPVRSSERLQRKSDEMRCHFCNEPGHFVYQCPKRIRENKDAGGFNSSRPIAVNQIQDSGDKEYKGGESTDDDDIGTTLLAQDPGRLVIRMIYVLRRLEEVESRNVNLIWCYDCGQVAHTRKDCKSDMKGLGLFMPQDVRNNKVMQVPIVQRPVVDRQMVLEALKEVMRQIHFNAPFAISPCGYCNSNSHNTGPDCPGLVKEIEEKSKNLAEPQTIQAKQMPTRQFTANNREALYPKNPAPYNKFVPVMKRTVNRVEDQIYEDQEGRSHEESLN